ncbi:C-type lectin domain family 4 member G-like [Parambassis ranga]|uniref:C-type lectin domain family 4 member G-like n=1 Tax=Parambassis ranga TaxID=210632 RepID=A0A6P7JW25_9TELE|nr:C-type lectin domain family 4 member G-like [Parambassis ranga]
METVQYVNSPVDERRERRKVPSGGSKIFMLVGVSFGLLCIIQAALNVSLRLQAGSSDRFNNSNSTMMSADDVRNSERDRLTQENHRLLQKNSQLQVINTTQQLEIQELRAQIKMALNVQGCPQGWVRFQSSCYQGSSHENTWDFAKQDCESKGAHLVIMKGQLKKNIVRAIGSADLGVVTMWLGLSGHYNTRTSTWTWRWVDGSSFFPSKLKGRQSLYRNCVHVAHPSLSVNWTPGSCQDQHHWMCEMELQSSFVRPK